MRDKPPQRVKIIGKTYRIKHVKRVDKEKNAGEHDGIRQIIKVRQNQCFEALRDTVIHEITHAIDEQIAAGLKERQVHAMATGMLQVLRENPTLVQFLTGRPRRK